MTSYYLILLFDMMKCFSSSSWLGCAGVPEAGDAHETLQKGHAAADVLPGEQLKSNLRRRYFSFPVSRSGSDQIGR